MSALEAVPAEGQKNLEKNKMCFEGKYFATTILVLTNRLEGQMPPRPLVPPALRSNDLPASLLIEV